MPAGGDGKCEIFSHQSTGSSNLVLVGVHEWRSTTHKFRRSSSGKLESDFCVYTPAEKTIACQSNRSLRLLVLCASIVTVQRASAHTVAYRAGIGWPSKRAGERACVRATVAMNLFRECVRARDTPPVADQREIETADKVHKQLGDTFFFSSCAH